MVLADCRAHKTFCWVARKANADVIERIRALNLQGIHFQKESKRFYPKRELSAQVLGYVGTDDEGLSGIERGYDEQLRGQPGRMQISVDARKKWFARIEKEPEPGDNVVLTIDEKIQYIVERELEQAMKDTQAIAGTVIVENPHTGEILALANRPNFNPNVKKEIKNEALKNRAVSDIYEPGSTFKLVTIAGALEEKLTQPDELFDCQMGSIVINGMIKQELLLPFIGGVFVIEALSVILQVASYKLRKKRIFKMAPIHHHFELMGWSESKVIVRFWIASLVFALFALTTLKLR